MVGHTHEDIDQLFSCVSKLLKKHRTVTLDHLQNAIETSYQKLTITTSIITYIFDIKNWIHPYLQDIRYHSKPHQFKFTLDDIGKCIMKTKNWSTDEKWADCTKELETSPYLLKGIPDGSPELSSPDFENVDVPKLQRSIVSVKQYLRTEELEWWKQFLNRIDDCEMDLQRFPLHDIIFNGCEARPIEEEIVTSGAEGDVHIGRLSKRKPAPQLEVGTMVATALERYPNEWPQVGQISHVTDEIIEVMWYTGTYSSLFIKCIKNGQDWIERISKQDVICLFRLTQAGRLPGSVIDRLKEEKVEFLNRMVDI